MISGIVGRPGHGKSLEAARQALLAHRAGDTHIYANIPMNLERHTLVSPDGRQPGTIALTAVRPGMCECKCSKVFVLLDEVHLWLPARRSLQLPTSWLALFSQTRKLGWELWWTAQNEMRVDRMLRDVTSWMYLATGWGWPLEFYIYERYEPEKFRNKAYRMGRDVRRRSRSASAVYNTLGSVAGATHVEDKNDPYANQAAGTTERKEVA